MIDAQLPFALLKNRIDLKHIPFTDRGSRVLVQQVENVLTIRLVERWAKLDVRIMGYLERPPILGDFTFTDEQGTSLDFELESYPDRLIFHTSSGDFGMVFADQETLVLSLPENGCGLSFHAHMDLGQTDRRGGVLGTSGDIRRNMAYTTGRLFLENSISPAREGTLQVRMSFAPGPPAGLLLNLTPRLGFNRYLPNLDAVFQAAHQRWQDWFLAAPPVAEPYLRQYYYAWYVMRAGLI